MPISNLAALNVTTGPVIDLSKYIMGMNSRYPWMKCICNALTTKGLSGMCLPGVRELPKRDK